MEGISVLTIFVYAHMYVSVYVCIYVWMDGSFYAIFLLKDTAYCLNPYKDKFYCFDDQDVKMPTQIKVYMVWACKIHTLYFFALACANVYGCCGTMVLTAQL